MKIREGDTVVVIAGKDKGKTGTVLRVLPMSNRVIVTGINMRTKHVKKTFQRPGQRLRYEASIAISNVMMVDAKTKKRSRVGYKFDEKGNKKRVTKRSGELIVQKKVAAPAAAMKTAGAKGEEKAANKKMQEDPVEGQKPSRQPFWKKLGFGADALEEAAEVPGEPRSKQDGSVPKDSQLSSPRAHQRGS